MFVHQLGQVVVHVAAEIGLVEVGAGAGSARGEILIRIPEGTVSVPVREHPEPVGLAQEIAVLAAVDGKGVPLAVVTAHRSIEAAEVVIHDAVEI